MFEFDLGLDFSVNPKTAVNQPKKELSFSFSEINLKLKKNPLEIKQSNLNENFSKIMENGII